MSGLTQDEIDRVCEFFRHRGHVPVPIAEWREWAMATKVKGTVTKDGKFKPADTTPASLRTGKALKAARVEKGLKANREKARKA